MENNLAEVIQIEYYHWLINLINPRDHNKLLEWMMNQTYTWVVPMDENRAADGEELRHRFLYENGYVGYDLPNDPCTLLEFFVGVANKANDIMADGEDDDLAPWFWLFMVNLELDEYIDDIFEANYGQITRKLHVFLERKYAKNGVGGMFPMENSRTDQRKIEIWYQLNGYLNEYYD